MAHTKSGGSTHLGRDSASKRLGVKIYDGQAVKPGNIIIRQRGRKFTPGDGVRRGSDDTLYAVKAGVARFVMKRRRIFSGKQKTVRIVSVVQKAESRN